MKFDGSDILVGDNAYDLVFGVGTVDHVNEAEQKISVRFGDRMYTYTSTGIGHFPQKTLFWQDPVSGYTPMKSDHRWEHFCELRKALAQVVWSSRSIKENGAL